MQSCLAIYDRRTYVHYQYIQLSDTLGLKLLKDRVKGF